MGFCQFWGRVEGGALLHILVCSILFRRRREKAGIRYSRIYVFNDADDGDDDVGDDDVDDNDDMVMMMLVSLPYALCGHRL